MQQQVRGDIKIPPLGERQSLKNGRLPKAALYAVNTRQKQGLGRRSQMGDVAEAAHLNQQRTDKNRICPDAFGQDKQKTKYTPSPELA